MYSPLTIFVFLESSKNKTMLAKFISKLKRIFRTKKHNHDKSNPGHGDHRNRKAHRMPLASMWGLSPERKLARIEAIESVSKNFKKRMDSL